MVILYEIMMPLITSELALRVMRFFLGPHHLTSSLLITGFSKSHPVKRPRRILNREFSYSRPTRLWSSRAISIRSMRIETWACMWVCVPLTMRRTLPAIRRTRFQPRGI